MDITLTCFNENTSLIEREGSTFIKKRISADDAELFQKLRRLDSPYLAKVFEIGFDGDYLYALTEYIPGETLAEAIEESGGMELKETIRLVLDVCAGLRVLHENGIVHRDINPSNIVIRPDGHAAIIDYGISRIEKENKTSDTSILGTAGYASPEQFGFSQTDAKSDIYSMGILLNVLLTGNMPNESKTGTRLDPIISRCTKIKPDERFESVNELSYALKLVYNKEFPKEIIPVKKPILKRILSVLYFVTASLFTIVFPLAGTYSGEKICMFFISFFTLILPQIFTLVFNSRQRLFYYTNQKSRRMAFTLISVIISIVVAFIILVFTTQKWADS